MAFKINIGTKSGRTYRLEAEAPGAMNKELGSKVKGIEISPDLEGYEFEIAGASDKAGFTSVKEVEGVGLKKVLLGYGLGMKKKPKGLSKKKRKSPQGLRLRKTVRGKVISQDTAQLNLRIIKDGSKKLEDIFPDQSGKPAETPKEEAKVEAAPVEATPAQ